MVIVKLGIIFNNRQAYVHVYIHTLLLLPHDHYCPDEITIKTLQYSEYSILPLIRSVQSGIIQNVRPHLLPLFITQTGPKGFRYITLRQSTCSIRPDMSPLHRLCQPLYHSRPIMLLSSVKCYSSLIMMNMCFMLISK